MRKWAALFAVAALMAAAFFLPEWLSGLHDRQLLDAPSIQSREEDQEGFAESIQLSVAEKIQLLRGGTLTGMELSSEAVTIEALPGPDGETSLRVDAPSLHVAAEEAPDLVAYEEAVSRLWEERQAAVLLEIRSLQAIGGLPELWGADEEPDYISRGELLYMEPDSGMTFQVYGVTLSSASLSLDLRVDAQSGRILSFLLQWGRDGVPSWGMRGAVNFGSVWRNYWGMDSVGSGWYTEHTRSILERTPEAARNDGDYSAHGQVTFTYDGQPVPVPLDCWAIGGRTCSISWNY